LGLILAIFTRFWREQFNTMTDVYVHAFCYFCIKQQGMTFLKSQNINYVWYTVYNCVG
jgi:hypothetical protein